VALFDVSVSLTIDLTFTVEVIKPYLQLPAAIVSHLNTIESH
jgi:hypothetical protein